MSKEQKNMEDFLKEKLSHGGEDFTDDWSVFEQKLERALFFKQMRVGALVSVVLIMLSIGFFGSSSFSSINVFQNRNADAVESFRGDGRFSDFKANKNASFQAEAEVESALVSSEQEILQAEPGDKGAQVERTVQQMVAENDIQAKENSKVQPVAKVSSAAYANNAISDDIVESEIAESSSAQAENTGAPIVLAMADAEESSDDQGVENSVEALESEVSGGGVKKEASGMALVPDGLESSNFKFNTKPIELMVDLGDLKVPSLRAPVIPLKLTKAKKEAYVSPLQEKKPWSYSIKVYPNFTYRKFSVAANKMPYIHRDFIDQVKVSESGGFSLNVGFEASKRIGRITYLNLGVEYINYKTEANFDFINYRDAVISTESGKITSYDFRNEAEHIVIVDDNRYQYLNFPLSIAYRPWATDHVRINIEAGASYMYFIQASGKSIDYQTLEIIDLADRDYRNSMASVCLKVGASYHISEKFNFGFEPTVVYFSNTIYSEEYPFEVVPYSVGVNFKLQMKLN